MTTYTIRLTNLKLPYDKIAATKRLHRKKKKKKKKNLAENFMTWKRSIIVPGDRIDIISPTPIGQPDNQRGHNNRN